MPIHAISFRETVTHIIDASNSGFGGWVVTPNLDILRRYHRSLSFRNLVAASSLNVADGMPLIWASRIKGQALPGRVNGTDLLVEICKAASTSQRSVFFLGGDPGSAERSADAMQQQFPSLNVAGSMCPDFGFEQDIEAINKISWRLEQAKPDIVFVGLGSPKQDVLIAMLRLKFPQVWWIGVGVSFSFLAGDLTRAPEWAKKAGLEWFCRLITEPRRLAKRYLVDGIPFFFSTLLTALLANARARLR